MPVCAVCCRKQLEGVEEMVKWREKGSDFIFIEDEVRLYHFYQREIDKLEADIIFATPEYDDNGGGKSNIPGRPTENIVAQLVEHNQLKRMRKYIKYIGLALDELDDEKRRFVERLYWSNKSKAVPVICEEFNISAATLRRWRKAFLLRVGFLTGDYRGNIYK